MGTRLATSMIHKAGGATPKISPLQLSRKSPMSEEAITVRPVFFYNQNKSVGDHLGLHLFEPRFKELISRVWTTALELQASAPRDRRGGLPRADALATEFLFLPNYVKYEASAGDVGLIARLDDVQIFPDGRAALQATLVRWAVVRHHWVEDATYGLHYALCSDLAGPPPQRAGVMALSRTLAAPARWTPALAALPLGDPRRRACIFHTTRPNWIFDEPRTPRSKEGRMLRAGVDVEVLELREVGDVEIQMHPSAPGVHGPTVCARVRFSRDCPRVDPRTLTWPAGAHVLEGWVPRWLAGIEFLRVGRAATAAVRRAATAAERGDDAGDDDGSGGDDARCDDVAAAIERLGVRVSHPARHFRRWSEGDPAAVGLNNPIRPTATLMGARDALDAARARLGAEAARSAIFIETPQENDLVALLPVVLALARHVVDLIAVPHGAVRFHCSDRPGRVAGRSAPATYKERLSLPPSLPLPQRARTYHDRRGR